MVFRILIEFKSNKNLVLPEPSQKGDFLYTEYSHCQQPFTHLL